jgi:hypothetical protein
MDFPEFNFQREILWTGSTAHGPEGMLGFMLDRAAAWTRGTAASMRAHRSSSYGGEVV